jgi:desulfoferrodoxin (superoxide reductase-like protein)
VIKVNEIKDLTLTLTKGVVDDLKQSKVAGRYAVHSYCHDHSLWESEKGLCINKEACAITKRPVH